MNLGNITYGLVGRVAYDELYLELLIDANICIASSCQRVSAYDDISLNGLDYIMPRIFGSRCCSSTFLSSPKMNCIMYFL